MPKVDQNIAELEESLEDSKSPGKNGILEPRKENEEEKFNALLDSGSQCPEGKESVLTLTQEIPYSNVIIKNKKIWPIRNKKRSLDTQQWCAQYSR